MSSQFPPNLRTSEIQELEIQKAVRFVSAKGRADVWFREIKVIRNRGIGWMALLGLILPGCVPASFGQSELRTEVTAGTPATGNADSQRTDAQEVVVPARMEASPTEAEGLPDAPRPRFEIGAGNVNANAALEAKPAEIARLDAGTEAASSDVAVNGYLPASDASFSSAMEGIAMSSGGGGGVGVSQGLRAYVPLDRCPYDKTHARECRLHVKDLAIEASLFLAFENAGNVYTGYWYRYETTTGKWWDRYVNSVEDWRWTQWSDNNPFLDDYVGHPMMGAITNGIWIQNDPQGMTLEQSNSWEYYRSRLRALAFSTFYSFEWKLGPIGEASVGHNGDHYYHDGTTYTNETGWVELVTTPIGGLGWTMAEDALDKHVVRRLEEKSHNPLLLTIYQFLTPSKGFDNILRFRPPWYRDSRVVKSSGFFSEPGEGMTATTAASVKYANVHGDDGGMGVVQRVPVIMSPEWQGPGGKHEFGATWGLSVMSGHVFGYAADVKYMPITLRYSYELYRHHESWTLRYAPELTALAMIDWPTPTPIGKGEPGTVFNQRQRAYGSGLSPIGFESDFRPLSRFQPFFRMNGGAIYFDERVLNKNGSQFMYTIGPDVGFNIYRHQRQAVTIGWRYTHLSNANISLHNPGTDANVFYVGISRFRTKGDTAVQ